MRNLKRAWVGWLTAVAIVAGPTSALACRQIEPATISYSSFDTVVIVRVTEAQSVGSGAYKDWMVQATADQVVEGAAALKTYAFSASSFRGTCPLGDAPPNGERWVLYMASQNPLLNAAYPLSYVKAYDKRLSGAAADASTSR